MAGAAFSAHEGVWGRVREATFSGLGLQTHSGGVLGSIFADFRRFWVPFGVHLGSILGLKRCFFSGPNFSHFLEHFWEGPAAGAGPVKYAEYANIDVTPVTPGYPCGMRQILRLSPCRRPPCQLQAAGCKFAG